MYMPLAESDTVADVAMGILQVLGAGAAGVLGGAILSILVSGAMKVLRRRDPIWTAFSRRMRAPQRMLFVVLGAGVGVLIATQSSTAGTELAWRPYFVQVLTVVLILLTAWLLHAFLRALEEAVLSKFEGAEQTTHARRARTQMQMMRRILVTVIWTSALVGSLMTFPAFRGIGATFFASAGLASIVAGLAAQSTLGNLFAGMQIAFTDSVRVGDVVVLGTNHGSVEEMTLNFVVLRTWDGRRLIIPSSDFTTQPFENWTRRGSELLGTVFLEVDWFTPLPALRIELQRIVEGSDLWDGRTCTMQVTDAVDGKVTVRAVVSAQNSGLLWDLRCLVREDLVEWTQQHAPYSVPRTRIEPNTTTAPPLAEREEFIENVEREWAEEHREEEAEEDAGAVLEVPPVPAPPEEEGGLLGWLWPRDDAAQVRKEAERADRRAAREDPTILSGHERVLPSPSAEETRLISKDELEELEVKLGGADIAAAPAPAATRAPAAAPAPAATRAPAAAPAPQAAHQAESRMFSGSPEAEERARQLVGPESLEFAKIEEEARRRAESATEEKT